MESNVVVVAGRGYWVVGIFVVIVALGCEAAKTPIAAGPFGEWGNQAQLQSPATDGWGHVAIVHDTADGVRELYVLGLCAPIGETWERVPTRQPRVAEFVLPGPAEPATLAVTYFGRDEGGTAEANIRRWLEQVADREEAVSRTFRINDLDVHVVMAVGTIVFGENMAQGQMGTPRPESALFGLIIEGGPHGKVFVRATGPAATIEANLPALDALMRNLRIAEPPQRSQTMPAIERMAPEDGQLAIVAGLEFVAPKTWQPKPASEMRHAEFAVATPTGVIEVIVFYFGAGQGGSAQANLDRWLSQVPDAGASTQMAFVDAHGLRITLLSAMGTYTGDIAPPSAEANSAGPPVRGKPNQMLVAATIEHGPQGSVFVKAVGPAAAVAAHFAEIEAFMLSARPVSR